MEPELPSLIEHLKNQGATVVALTAATTHHLGWSDLGPKLRYEELLAHNIAFSCPLNDYVTFDGCDIEWGYFPTYYKGIITAGCSPKHNHINSKGKVVSHLIAALPTPPKRVIFIDDSKRHIESVKKALEETEIEYLGIHYRGVEQLPSQDISLEEFKAVWEELISEAQYLAETYFN